MPLERELKPRNFTLAEAMLVAHIVDESKGQVHPNYTAAIEKVTARNVDRVVNRGIKGIEDESKDADARHNINNLEYTPAQMMDYCRGRHSMSHAIQCIINNMAGLAALSHHCAVWSERRQLPAAALSQTRALLSRQLDTGVILRHLMIVDIYRRIAEAKQDDKIWQRFKLKAEQAHDVLVNQVVPYDDLPAVSEGLQAPLPSTDQLYKGLIWPLAARQFTDFESNKEAVHTEICLAFGDDPTVRHRHPYDQKMFGNFL